MLGFKALAVGGKFLNALIGSLNSLLELLFLGGAITGGVVGQGIRGDLTRNLHLLDACIRVFKVLDKLRILAFVCVKCVQHLATLCRVNPGAGNSRQPRSCVLERLQLGLVAFCNSVLFCASQGFNFDFVQLPLKCRLAFLFSACGSFNLLVGLCGLNNLLHTGKFFFRRCNISLDLRKLCVNVASFFCNIALDLQCSGQLLLRLLEFFLVFAAALLCGSGFFQRQARIEQRLRIAVQYFFLGLQLHLQV